MITDFGERVRAVCDRFWMFTIAAIALALIGGVIAAIAFSDKEISPEAMALLGSLSTGLMMLVQKVIEAQQQRRMADHLAGSRPDDQQPTKEAG